MEVIKGSQIYIHTADSPGQLAKVMAVVSEAGINCVAYAGYAEGDRGHVMLVSEENMKLVPIFEAAGFDVREELVVLVKDRDVQGSALGIAQRLSVAGINLSGAYATSAGGEYLTVLKSDDVEALIAALL